MLMASMFKILLSFFLNFMMAPVFASNQLIVDFQNIEVIAGNIYNVEVHVDKDAKEPSPESFITPFLFLLSIDSRKINDNNYDKITLNSKVVITNDFDGKTNIDNQGSEIRLLGIKSFEKTDVNEFSFYQLGKNNYFLFISMFVVFAMCGVFAYFYLKRNGQRKATQFQFKTQGDRRYYESIFNKKDDLISHGDVTYDEQDIKELIDSIRKIAYKKTWSNEELEQLNNLNQKLILRKE